MQTRVLDRFAPGAGRGDDRIALAGSQPHVLGGFDVRFPPGSGSGRRMSLTTAVSHRQTHAAPHQHRYFGTLPCRRGEPSTASQADSGVSEGGGAPVVDHAAGEIGEDRCQGGQPWPVGDVPIGRGGGAEGTVPDNPEPDR